MPTLILRLPHDGSEAQRAAVEAASLDASAAIVWHDHDDFGLSYAVVRYAGERPLLPHGVTVYDAAIIAMALTPSPREALPALLHALGGPGRPKGVLAALHAGEALVVEIAPAITSALFILQVADVELARLRGSRVTRLLLPLDLGAATAIAATGLSTEGIAPDRVLEFLLERDAAIL